MKKLYFILSLALVLCAFAALLLAPGEAVAGAKRGLAVCAGTIVPSLLPFLVLSGMLTDLGLPGMLAHALGPLFRRLFGLPGAAAVPFLLGLTGGYPVGAASVAELVGRGELTPEEGGRALPWCNNTGPAFIIGAAGGVFASPAAGALLYLSHILAATILGLLFSSGPRRREDGTARRETAVPTRPLSDAFPGSVKRAVAAVLNICGFVVFFSVVTALLERTGLLTELSALAAERFGLAPRFTRALFTGLLELGGGVAALAGLPPSPGNLALTAWILGFGSLSVHCQTLAALGDAGVPAGRHFAGRCLHGLLSGGLAYVFGIIFLS
ncbi:MAG: sporulation protein [Oscillospiraceae bacterium]|nr:sporulation protein [Oscillospiraceae bacterium]